jgi:hypothetical protein
MSTQKSAPKLSVIVVSFNGPARLEGCLTSLERQTLQDSVETLVVGHWDTDHRDREALQHRFPEVRWIHAPQEYNVPQMRGLGMGASRGEIIALLEDDCVAAEDWHDHLLKAHEGPHAAVGGVVEPGDYTRVVDWVAYFCEYVRFMGPVPAGEVLALPGTNVSYKRKALAEVLGHEGASNGQLTSGAFYEVLVHLSLRQRGRTLGADPSLVVHNVNSWNLGELLRTRFHHGRGFAGMRLAGQPRWQRLPFLVLALILPFVQVGRIARQVVSRKRHVGRLVQALPAIILVSISWSAGEFAGYLLGPGQSLSQWR